MNLTLSSDVSTDVGLSTSVSVSPGTAPYTWTSSNERIATPASSQTNDPRVEVNGVGLGSATITVTDSNGNTGSTPVGVGTMLVYGAVPSTSDQGSLASLPYMVSGSIWTKNLTSSTDLPDDAQFDKMQTNGQTAVSVTAGAVLDLTQLDLKGATPAINTGTATQFNGNPTLYIYGVDGKLYRVDASTWTKSRYVPPTGSGSELSSYSQGSMNDKHAIAEYVPPSPSGAFTTCYLINLAQIPTGST